MILADANVLLYAYHPADEGHGAARAWAAVSSWLERSMAGILDPGERHWTILGDLLRGDQVRGPLIMDAALAALAIEHGATLHTTDGDFARFPGLKWRDPLRG